MIETWRRESNSFEGIRQLLGTKNKVEDWDDEAYYKWRIDVISPRRIDGGVEVDSISIIWEKKKEGGGREVVWGATKKKLFKREKSRSSWISDYSLETIEQSDYPKHPAEAWKKTQYHSQLTWTSS